MRNILLGCILATSITQAQVELDTTNISSGSKFVENKRTFVLSENSKISGKINPYGKALSIQGAVSYMKDSGIYRITFNTPMPNKDYLITLTVSDDLGHGSTIISYFDQDRYGFCVRTKDAYLLNSAKVEFMFNVEIIN